MRNLSTVKYITNDSNISLAEDLFALLFIINVYVPDSFFEPSLQLFSQNNSSKVVTRQRKKKKK